MPKIERKYLAHYINAAPDEAVAVYERLGTDLEEYSPEMSAQVETKENILGERSVAITGYEKTAAVEPYYADSGSPLFSYLQRIIDGDLTMSSLKTDVVEVKLWEDLIDNGFPAVREEVYIEVTGYGGDTTGYQIPFTLHYTGRKTGGIFDVAAGEFRETA